MNLKKRQNSEIVILAHEWECTFDTAALLTQTLSAWSYQKETLPQSLSQRPMSEICNMTMR